MNRDTSIWNYQRALEGKVEIHIWRGASCPWMKSVAVEPGTPVDGDDHDMPEGIVDGFGVYYGGVMQPEELQERLDTLTQAPDHP